VNDYLLHEMTRMRADELRAEVVRARTAKGVRGRRVGILGGLWTTRAEEGGGSRGTIEEACCA
jgi:hypothetical protein